MRTSHRQIRKRILDTKSKITDEEFFSSRAYCGYLTDLAEAATKRYHRPLRVKVVADHDDDTVAFTDYHGIFINTHLFHQIVLEYCVSRQDEMSSARLSGSADAEEMIVDRADS